MGKVRKISKSKGVEICANRIYAGVKSKEIIRELTESYGISVSCCDKWMKAARPAVAERQAEAQRIMARENEAAIIESAKRLNLTRERILEEYAKIAFFDIRTIFTVDGGMKPIQEIDDQAAGAIAGIEIFEEKTTVKENGETVDSITQGVNKKIKVTEKTRALDSICKVMGYNAPEKSELLLTKPVIIDWSDEPGSNPI